MKTVLFLFAMLAVVVLISSEPINHRLRRSTDDFVIQCNQQHSNTTCSQACRVTNGTGGYCNSGSCVCR